jgi:hypothetical protein
VIDQSRSTTSTSTSTSASATSLSSGFPATCPTDDQKNITDTNGISYQLRCSSDISSINGGPESGFGASNNFNDCILQCDTYIFPGNNIACSGFAYVGGVNGVGAGTCYLKGGAPYNVVAASNTVVAAVRLAATSSASSSTVQATTTTTSTTRTTTTSTTQTTTTSTTQTTTTSTTQTTTTSTALTTTTTNSSSSSSSAVATALSTYSCPANDGQVVTDSGSQYQLRCGYQAQPVSGAGTYQTTTGQSSLNVCLRACTTNSIEDKNNTGTFPTCAGFTFVVGSSGDGSGNCAYRQQNPLQFGSPSAAFIGLIKIQYYQAAVTTTTFTTTTSTTTTSTMSTSASSVQTLTYTTVSYATVTTTSSYPVTTTAISTQVQTVTTSYPVTTTQVSTAPGKFGTLQWPKARYCRYLSIRFLTKSQAQL